MYRLVLRKCYNRCAAEGGEYVKTGHAVLCTDGIIRQNIFLLTANLIHDLCAWANRLPRARRCCQGGVKLWLTARAQSATLKIINFSRATVSYTVAAAYCTHGTHMKSSVLVQKGPPTCGVIIISFTN